MALKEQIIELWGQGQFKKQEDLAHFLSISPAYVSRVLSKPKREKKEPKDYFNTKAKDVDEALVRACEKGNAQALRTYYQLTQRLIEKREDTHKFEFTADDYTRIARETVDGLREEFQRLGGRCSVCGEYKTLRNQALSGAEPEQSENREVATLAIPTRPD